MAMTAKKIRIIGTPMDLGQSRRGVDMGPSAIRYAGLQDRLQRLGYEVIDSGNVNTAQAEELSLNAVPEPVIEGNAHHLHEVARVCQKIYDRVQSYRPEDRHYIFLGGDHSMAIGTVSAVTHDRLGVIWFDAHADINTPLTSVSGNIHGMPVAALLGDGPDALTHVGFAAPKLQPHQIVLVGTRDLDDAERQRLARRDVRVYTMREVDEMGMAKIGYEILDYFRDMTALHLSLDLDALDPQIAPGVGTPVPGGFSYREAHLFMEIMADSQKVRSLDVVEVNPILDQQNVTAKLAVELAAGVFGQRIL
jgi:arginase